MYMAERTTDVLRDLGVRVVDGTIETFLRRPEIIFDAVIISRPTNLPYLDLIRETHPEATVIMDHEALYHRRIFRQAAMATDAEEADRLTVRAKDMLDQETLAGGRRRSERVHQRGGSGLRARVFPEPRGFGPRAEGASDDPDGEHPRGTPRHALRRRLDGRIRVAECRRARVVRGARACPACVLQFHGRRCA